jgi:two-component system OmpR family sensor kinase
MRGVRAAVGLDESAIPGLISALGGLFLLAFFVEAAVFSGLDPDVLFSDGPLVAFLTVLPFVGGLTYGGYWLAGSDVTPERYSRVGAWTVGGAAAFLGLNLILIVFFTPDRLWLVSGWARGTATMGAAVGLLVGIIEARAIENALAAERSRLRAEQLETRREWLDYLNGLLRHEVLNTAQVINGYAATVLDDTELPAETRSRLAAIQRQSEDMTDIIGDVRVLLDATRGEATFEPVDLTTVLEDEIRDLRDVYGAVEVESDLPESVAVRADPLLPRVFSNLLGNAVEHNDSELARVEVSVETTESTAVVEIEDNGPGIDAAERATLFERGTPTKSNHGLGLYLVRQLVERYDGTVEVVDTGADGTTVAVELPLAAGAPVAEPAPGAEAETANESAEASTGDPGLDREAPGAPR